MAPTSCRRPVYRHAALDPDRAMPELPEVETTRQGLLPRLRGRPLARIAIRNPRLRWPIPDDLETRLAGLRGWQD